MDGEPYHALGDGPDDDMEFHHDAPADSFTHEFQSIDPALHDPPAHGAHAQHYDAHIPRHLYTPLPPPAPFLQHAPPEPLPALEPRFASASPPHASYLPPDRALPLKDAADDTLDDAYVDFILYCNPAVALDTDTAELRKAFRQPPKSDGKTFNMAKLLQLIGRFEDREIKTWTTLALELGVERKADSSNQKVQQYAVRLKVGMICACGAEANTS